MPHGTFLLLLESLISKTFSSSTIFHTEKTKKIKTVTVVWISDTNYNKMLWTLSLNYFSTNYCSFEKLYQKLHPLFHSIPRHLKVSLKKLSCTSFFNPLLSVWISNETLCVVFDIQYYIKNLTSDLFCFLFRQHCWVQTVAAVSSVCWDCKCKNDKVPWMKC